MGGDAMRIQYLTVAEAAEALRICSESVRRAVRAGKIPGARRVPGGTMIRIPAAYVEDQAETTPPAAAPIIREGQVGEPAGAGSR
jgi:excisionase family DNA binding protein